MTEQMKQLAEPFPHSSVKFRVGATNKDKTKGLALAYIDARDVEDRLDSVAGLEWSDSYTVLGKGGDGLEVECCLTVFGVTRTDAGIGDNAKDAYSDALKRAAVKFGVGRYLYRLPQSWVRCEMINNNPKRIKMLETPTLPYWALPEKSKMPANENRPAPLMVRTDEQNKYLHMLGIDFYKDEWDTERKRLCDWVSKGRVSSSALLTIDECQRLIDGLKVKVSA